MDHKPEFPFWSPSSEAYYTCTRCLGQILDAFLYYLNVQLGFGLSIGASSVLLPETLRTT